MTYKEALTYLDSFINFERADSYNYSSSLRLERVKRLAALLGDPQKKIPSIHIAGSKGKGSTASFIYSILKSAGFKAGLYTSPHLISFRERIRINDELISEEDLSRILDKIRDAIESSMKDDRPSFFEVYTVLAYMYFREKNIDFAVYETGLGGRLDATNLVEPLICAITPLSYEHTDKLGNTLKEIAAEKCGIIKSNAICVSAPQEEEALKVIKDACAERHTRLTLVGNDITFEEIRSDDKGELFNVSGIFNKYLRLNSKLIGPHQIVNAAVAIGVIEALKFRNITIPVDAVRQGISNAVWEGRLEIINKNPFIVLDGAQNRASARCLAEAIKKIFKFEKLILLFGVSKDKDIKGILQEILPVCDSLILTKSKVVNRAAEPAAIMEMVKNIAPVFKNVSLTSCIEDALNEALEKADKDDLILITGSLFIVGEAKNKWKTEKCLKAAA